MPPFLYFEAYRELPLEFVLLIIKYINFKLKMLDFFSMVSYCTWHVSPGSARLRHMGNWGINFSGSTFTENQKTGICEIFYFFWSSKQNHFSTFTSQLFGRQNRITFQLSNFHFSTFSSQLPNYSVLSNANRLHSLLVVRKWPFNRTPIGSRGFW